MRKNLVLVCGAVLAIGCDAKDDDDDGVANQGTATQASTDPEEEEDDDAVTETESDGEEEPVPEPEPESCDQQEASRACVVPGGANGGGNDGTQWCDQGAWGPCVEMAECELGEEMDCDLCGDGGDGGSSSGGEEPECEFEGLADLCSLQEGIPQWGCSIDAELCACATPLVLSFDGAEPQMLASPSSAFDIEVAGGCTSTDWPTSTTPWLALDRDGDGGIADGRELFGSGTRLGTGKRASNGFLALAELDDNRDGKITPADPRFGELVLWADEDGDKRGVGTELQSLATMGVLRIDLAYDKKAVCDARGNCGVERAAFTFVGRGGAIDHGAVIDVHLACK